MDINRVFKVPVRAYDLATGEVTTVDRYFPGQSMSPDTWQNQMLKAHRPRERLSYSNEWSGAQRHYVQSNPEYERQFVEATAWTGTVLDFGDETLKEGIVLNSDGTIASSGKVLGKKDKILLPHSSAYVKDLSDKHMPLVAYLHGVKDPKRKLPDYAYLWLESRGIKPVVRGGWDVGGRGYRRVDVIAGPADWWFAAWQVDEKRPKNVITPQEYEEMQRRLALNTVLVE